MSHPDFLQDIFTMSTPPESPVSSIESFTDQLKNTPLHPLPPGLGENLNSSPSSLSLVGLPTSTYNYQTPSAEPHAAYTHNNGAYSGPNSTHGFANGFGRPSEPSLSTADHLTLLRNPNYSQLFGAWIQLKQDAVQNKQKLDNMTLELRDANNAVEHWKQAHAHIANSVSLDKAKMKNLNLKPGALNPTLMTGAKNLQSLLMQKDDCPNIEFWTFKEWQAKINNPSTTTAKFVRGAKNKSFLETLDGQPLPAETIRAISSTSLQFFRSLLNAGIAPPSWGKGADLALKEWYLVEMLTRHPELRWGDSGWKATQLAMKQYSSWHKKNVINKIGAGESVKPEDDDADDYLGDTDDADGNEAGADHKRSSEATDSEDSPPSKKAKTSKDTGTSSGVSKTKPKATIKLVNPLTKIKTAKSSSTTPSMSAANAANISTNASPGSMIPPDAGADFAPRPDVAESGSGSGSPASTSPAPEPISPSSKSVAGSVSESNATALNTAPKAVSPPAAESASGSNATAPNTASEPDSPPASEAASGSNATAPNTASETDPPDATDAAAGLNATAPNTASEAAAPKAAPPIAPASSAGASGVTANPGATEAPSTLPKNNAGGKSSNRKPAADDDEILVPLDLPTAKNMCAVAWAKEHSGGTKGQFQDFWTDLTDEDKKGWTKKATREKTQRAKAAALDAKNKKTATGTSSDNN